LLQMSRVFLVQLISEVRTTPRYVIWITSGPELVADGSGGGEFLHCKKLYLNCRHTRVRIQWVGGGSSLRVEMAAGCRRGCGTTLLGYTRVRIQWVGMGWLSLLAQLLRLVR
jgi:hypothetical protein